MPSQRVDGRPVHAAHVFKRLISESDSGRAVYGCSFDRCAETEVRQRFSESPFAQRQEKARQRQAARKGATA